MKKIICDWQNKGFRKGEAVAFAFHLIGIDPQDMELEASIVALLLSAVGFRLDEERGLWISYSYPAHTAIHLVRRLMDHGLAVEHAGDVPHYLENLAA
ncbi:hypothetical protein ELG97_37075 [Rhizobium leguminosarum]|uniref:hypothetical protein n=1 Tax=Rhizobium leguminosarum TaxID=384 RepID=UPI001031888E|nr:hypothetical protein [Rhizobium leguminosarum]TBE73844.1 hypothetical protein ELG97_37075 [Rhizobium leguminosarum]